MFLDAAHGDAPKRVSRQKLPKILARPAGQSAHLGAGKHLSGLQWGQKKLEPHFCVTDPDSSRACCLRSRI